MHIAEAELMARSMGTRLSHYEYKEARQRSSERLERLAREATHEQSHKERANYYRTSRAFLRGYRANRKD